jgi:hypothetical protein
MAKNYDLTGQRFERLIVVNLKEKGKSKIWNCVCDCGNHIIVTTSHLLSGHTQSCGCKNRDNTINRNIKHGMCLKSRRLYGIWHAMKQRCFDKSQRSYPQYGGRGITICNEWLGDIRIFFDWAMSHGYADNLSIDRIDVNGHYCPENCRWVSTGEQARNKTSNIKITFNGTTRVLSDWAKIKGIDKSTLANRIKKGWSIEKALNNPAKHKGCIGL